MFANIPQYLIAAQFAQIAYAEREANEAAFKGGFTTPRYSYILSVTRQAIQYRYNLNPSDPTLQATGEFMFALAGGTNTTPDSVTTTFFIVTQPQSQTVNSGANVSFLVAVAGGTQPYSYQWRFNGTDISGETDPTLSLTSVDSGDAGNYSCVITDATGQVLTSNDAVLTVNAVALTGSFWYGDTDYFAALSAGTDAVPYQGTFPITHNASLVIPYTVAAGDNKMLVIRVPVGESLKSNWFNTALNNGTIQPSDGIFRVPLNPAGLPLYTYYLTELSSSYDFNIPNTLTLSS